MVPKWSYNGSMDAVAVSLSIKGVPADLAEALRRRAAENRRSIQGELMHILETAVRPRPFDAAGLVRQIKALGLATPRTSTKMIRRDRNR